MTQPAPISVVITYFQEKELLTRCVDSLLASTRQVQEILIHDDASPDPAANYVPKNPRIKIFRAEKNRGPSAGRNHLLARATGEYVHFHDSDDWFAPTWCARVMQELERNNLDVVYTEIDSVRHGAPYRQNVLDLAQLARGADLVSFSLTHAMLVPSGTYRTTLLQRLGGYRETLWQSEDFEFHARLAMAEPRVKLVTDALIYIEIRDNSRSQKQAEVWQWRLAALRLLFLDLAPKYYPAFIEALCTTGCRLYELGDPTTARDAYKLAGQLGTPIYLGRSLSFRLLAKALGPFRAEWVGEKYRALLPDNLRRRLRGPENDCLPEDSSIPNRKAS